MDLSASPLDTPQRPISTTEVLQGEASSRGAQNLQAITLYIYSKTFILDPNRGTNISKRLVIDRQTGRLTESDLTTPIPDGYEKKKTLSAFLGTITIIDKAFLLLVEDVLPVCNIEGNDIFSVSSTTFIPYSNENEIFSSSSGKEAINYIQNIRKVLSQGYYFSYTYDLTLSKVKQSTNSASDARFCWNNYMMRDLIKFKIHNKWLVPLIQGYIGYFNVYLVGKKLEFFLISRRSCYRSGTRYNARGLDDDGNVANFCESEQIIYYNGYCCSHVQIRGSVPVFFQQRGMTAQTKITRSFELANQAFLKHYDYVNHTYGRVLSVNLMCKTKPGEQAITDAYENHLKNNGLAGVRYEFFDFHHACKGHKFFKVNPLVLKVQPIIDNFKFYAEDTQKKTILMTQKGIIRTNCLDCLDRTNVFMTKVAATIFDSEMKHLGVDLKTVFGQDILSQLDNDNIKQQHPFILQYKNVWADNGDIISWHYAGTGSVISNVTRTGKETFMGMLDHGMKSLNRFYIGNFEDSVKQECIDILLGQHTETVNVFGEQFEAAVKKREKEFASYDEVKVFVTTWNVGGFDPTPQFDLTNLFNDFEGNGTPEIVIFGLQEFVSLNASNIMATGPNESQIQKWVDVILSNLKRYGEYLFMRERNLVGIQLFVFAKDSIRHRISKVDTDIVKTGMAGMGNKGGVIVKFHIDDSSFGIVNCHLEHGSGQNSNRLLNLIDIHERAFQEVVQGKKREEKLMNLDYKFLLGDMNFRVTLPNTDVRNMISDYISFEANGKVHEANELMNKLLSYDQLAQSRKSNDILEKYQEGEITFLPSYKYDPFSNIYDSSKKQRVPSWTDRVLWSCDFGIVKQLFYQRRDYRESDHRPVVSMFVVEVKKIDSAKRDVVVKEVYENDTQLLAAIEEEQRRNSLNNIGLLDLEDKEGKIITDGIPEDYLNV